MVLAVLGVVLVVYVVGFGVSIGEPFGSPAEPATLAEFETANATCETHRHQNGTYTRRVEDGILYLSIDGEIPVAARDSTVTARVDTIGGNDSGRHMLQLRRESGNRSADCYLETRYNATVAIPEPRDYTLLVTHDGHLREIHYIEGSGGGGWSTSEVEKPPGVNTTEWERALNASRAYQETHQRGE